MVCHHCPVCGNQVDPKQAKHFPKLGTEARSKFCKSLGVSAHIFNHIDTPRMICLQHFGSTTTQDQNGENVTKYDALPKTLSITEKNHLFANPSPSRYKKPSSKPNVPTAMPKPPPNNLLHSETSDTVPPITLTSQELDSLSHAEDNNDDGEVIQLENNSNTIDISNILSPKEQPKYLIVQSDKLLYLTSRCHECGHRPKRANNTVRFDGTACKTKLWCDKCNAHVEWESQDRIPGRKIYQGNVDIAAAVAAAPIQLASFLQFAMILNVAMFSRSTFYNYIPTFWQVVKDKYDKMQQKVIKYIQDKGESLHVAADGQYDSRGFSALQCCVTVMDAYSRLIITTVCLNKDVEKCASNAMEHHGLKKALNDLIGKGLQIATVTTDRSKSVIAMMQVNFKNIVHMFDPWHVIKGIAKILRLECKNKRAKKDFQPWCQAFLNHLWYCVVSANGSGRLCQQFSVSALLHAIGIHEWVEGPMSEVLHDNQAAITNVDPDTILKNDPLDLTSKLIHELQFKEHLGCMHDNTNMGDKALLDPTSTSYRVLLKAFTNDGFLNDVERLSPELATSALEGFHGLVSNIYRSKNHYLNLEGFTNRTKLAVLHYNHNVFDEIDGKRKVVREVNMKAKHRGGDIIKKQVKSKPDHSWKKEIAEEVRMMFEMKLDQLLQHDAFEDDDSEARYIDNDNEDLLEELLLSDAESDEEEEEDV